MDGACIIFSVLRLARSQAHASRRIVIVSAAEQPQWPGVSSVMIVMHAAGVLPGAGYLMCTIDD